MTEALLMGREEGGRGGKKREETGWRRNNGGDAKGNKMPSGVGPHKSRRVPTFLSVLVVTWHAAPFRATFNRHADQFDK